MGEREREREDERERQTDRQRVIGEGRGSEDAIRGIGKTKERRGTAFEG